MANINQNDRSATQNFAGFIWQVADTLRSVFKDGEYGSVILPFALLRRFECELEPTRDAVLSMYGRCREQFHYTQEEQWDALLRRTAKKCFYNTSSFRLATLGAQNTLANLVAYKNAFSSNVREILTRFDFEKTCERLAENDLLYITIDFFKQLDLTVENVSARAMSNLYEELIWRFASGEHQESKEFFTPRDIVHLATTLVLDSAGDVLVSDNGAIRTIYDPTCGTCGFISDAMDIVDEYKATNGIKAPLTLLPFGQEIQNEAWAMGKAMMMLRGDPNDPCKDASVNIFKDNTLTNDRTGNARFDFVLSNPPFGSDWKREADAVKREHELGEKGRFGAGLPPISDASMLFLSHVVKKLNLPTQNGGGHGAIVLSGSSLFSGGTGSSEIRRWLFEDDYVEAIIQLPSDLFYNTGITTYLWILSAQKVEEKRGKIQLIDASGFKTPMKNLGKKRFFINSDQIQAVARVFRDYKNSEISKIVSYRELGYREVSIKTPLRVKISITEDGITRLENNKMLEKLSDAEKKQLMSSLREVTTDLLPYGWLSEFVSKQKAAGLKLNKSIQNAMLKTFGVYDPNGDEVKDTKGNIIYSKEKMKELVSLTEDIGAYMKREVLPFAPDAVVDTAVVDEQDGQVGVVGYEVNFNKYFYKYVPPRSPEVIAKEILELEKETQLKMKELFE